MCDASQASRDGGARLRAQRGPPHRPPLWPAGLAGGVVLVLVLLATLLSGTTVEAQQAKQRRVALVIGIGKYEHAIRLANPPNDAASMADALRSLGFEVIQGIDVQRAELMNRLKEFSRKSDGADLALVFYAGHGVQVDNENWLLPRDARLADRLDLKFEAITATDLLQTMESAKGRILLLDACRDNPFKQGFLAQGANRSMTRGLARINTIDTGTLIAFATSPGAVADDGSLNGQQNSPFTQGLLENIRTPGLEIRQVLTRTRQSVIAVTKGRQTPWENSSLVADVYLAGGPAAPLPPPPATPLDLLYWKGIENSSDPADFTMFLQKFPKSELAGLATAKLKYLTLPSQAPVPQASRTKRDCSNCPEIVDIAAGYFVMGAPLSDVNASPSEHPAHRVDVPAFALSQFPVTFDEWQACVAEGGCATRPSDAGWGKGRRPVINVSWLDAKAYVDWLSRKTGIRYRLPSEAEWEYAARAGTTGTRFWGDDDKEACRYANVYDQTSKAVVALNWKAHPCADGFVHTSPVGSFALNPWRLGDMIGNVWQWVNDCWTDDYSGATGSAVAVSLTECTDHVLRGGSWMSDPAGARSTTRMRAEASEKDINIGFRVARDAR
jgi:formylglycine-generating enzyme required for sulfatase activity